MGLSGPNSQRTKQDFEHSRLIRPLLNCKL